MDLLPALFRALDEDGTGLAVYQRLVEERMLEQVLGMVMARYDLPLEAAGHILHRWAERAGVTNADMAFGVAAVASESGLQLFGELPATVRDGARGATVRVGDQERQR